MKGVEETKVQPFNPQIVNLEVCYIIKFKTEIQLPTNDWKVNCETIHVEESFKKSIWKSVKLFSGTICHLQHFLYTL